MTTTTAENHLLGWHFTNDHTLRDGRPVPPVGEWLVHEGDIKMCASGLHFSARVIDALAYAPGATLHQVEVRGVVKNNPLDKGVARERRIIKTYPAEDMLPVLVRFAWACAWRAQESAARAAAWAASDASAAVWAASDAARAARAASDARAAWAAWAASAAAWAASAAAGAAAGAADAADAAAWAAERSFQEQLLLAGLATLEGEKR